MKKRIAFLALKMLFSLLFYSEVHASKMFHNERLLGLKSVSLLYPRGGN